MTKLEQFAKERNIIHKKIIDILQAKGYKVTITNVNQYLGFYSMIKQYPQGILWRDLYEAILDYNNVNISTVQEERKTKQWANRYFKLAIELGFVKKTHVANDKRVVKFVWTEKAFQLTAEMDKLI